VDIPFRSEGFPFVKNTRFVLIPQRVEEGGSLVLKPNLVVIGKPMKRGKLERECCLS
jgi:hypothetical protein